MPLPGRGTRLPDHRHRVETSDLTTPVAQALTPTGGLIAYVGTSAPAGWLLCDGTSYLRADYAALFAIIGTAYGSVDGTHFNVPDLRQRFPLGKATAGTGATLGGTGGTIDHTHDLDTASSHARYDITVDAAANDPEIKLRSPVTQWTAGHAGNFSAGAGAATHTRGLELGGLTATANPPFQTVNYLVKT